jgi:hypothetical protein
LYVEEDSVHPVTNNKHNTGDSQVIYQPLTSKINKVATMTFPVRVTKNGVGLHMLKWEDLYDVPLSEEGQL